MRILITGAAGFIGYHCATALAEQGHAIYGVDSLNTYYSLKLKEARFRALPETTRFRKLNIANLPELKRVFQDFEPELVLNLAAQAGVRHSITHPQIYIESNIVGFANLLECCRHFGKPRLVYASSSSVYGGNQKLPFSVEDQVDHPISLYAATKKSNELMAHSYSHLYDLQTIGLRFFTVYGPWGRPDMAMWLFAHAIHKDRPINVFNHGDMSRDFTYIDDIVQGICASLLSTKLGRYEVFNLGNSQSEPLLRLVELIETCLGKKAVRKLLPMQDGDVKATFADIAHSKKLLNFVPHTKLEEGVPRFIDWFLAHPQFHA